MELKYVINNEDVKIYKDINSILKNKLNFSTRLLYKLIRQNLIFLNGINCDSRNGFKSNDILTINFNFDEDNSNVIPTKINLDIVYEDEWIIIVNKPAGIAVHPSLSHYSDSLSNGIRYYFDSINLKKKIRPVNRLDFNTSGLVIFAKCEYIQDILSKEMSENIFKKEYLCIINGTLDNSSGTIDLPIARKANSIIERCIDPSGQNSKTVYDVLKTFKDYSLVHCVLETGRTHQIRVHFSSIGHPLLGDTLYGTASPLISRQALHSYMISFIHPITKKEHSFTCPLPSDMKNLIYKTKLKKE